MAMPHKGCKTPQHTSHLHMQTFHTLFISFIQLFIFANFNYFSSLHIHIFDMDTSFVVYYDCLIINPCLCCEEHCEEEGVAEGGPVRERKAT